MNPDVEVALIIVFGVIELIGTIVYTVAILIHLTDIGDKWYYENDRDKRIKKERWKYMLAKKRGLIYIIFPPVALIFLVSYAFYKVIIGGFFGLTDLTD